jgi:glycosyltransferase involved in cell wall biosynthesis
MVRWGLVEVILIDSGSPYGEYSVFKQIMGSSNLPVVYARSAKRETIQNAWNRGIDLSRSRYLTFLGVDETIVPNCLETLAGELDKNPSLDWVVGNALVTAVNKDGQWVSDVMHYDRREYKQDLVYLETCYLSWVPSLYRRSIHDRFGYYDSSFRAAGDTEFKNRVLPFIKSKSIPVTLGIYRDYPEERTTASPIAEIEDLRAWYLHRTVGGINYAFTRRDPEELIDLLYLALRYRKSYSQHWSSDLEYASNVSSLIKDHFTKQNGNANAYFHGIKKLLDAYRAFDWVEKPTLASLRSTIINTWKTASEVEKEHRILNDGIIQPSYWIFNDNRHEQHYYMWRSET